MDLHGVIVQTNRAPIWWKTQVDGVQSLGSGAVEALSAASIPLLVRFRDSLKMICEVLYTMTRI